VFEALQEYGKAKEYFDKELAIAKEISDRIGEATSLGEHDKANQYHEKGFLVDAGD